MPYLKEEYDGAARSRGQKSQGSRQDGVGSHETGSPVATAKVICKTDPWRTMRFELSAVISFTGA